MGSRVKKTILRRTLIPIMLFGLASAGVTIFIISDYISDKLFSDRYRLIELVVDRAITIADFNNMSLQEFEAISPDIPYNLVNKVKLNALNSIASFAESFRGNNINLVVVEEGKTIFSNFAYAVRPSVSRNSMDKTVSIGGKAYIAHSVAFPQWKWEVFGLADKNIFMEPLARIQRIIVFSYMVNIFLVLLYVTFIFKDKIYKPLAQLLNNAGQITAGDLNRISIVTTAKEFAVLSEAFNVMLDSLNASLKAQNEYALNLRDANKELEHLTVDLEDIVEERTRELREANVKLRELDKLKTDLLSLVSHELRTPLTAVLGFTELIKLSLDSAIFPLVKPEDTRAQTAARQINGNISIIISEGERLAALINDFLDVSKLEAGKIEWEMEPVPVTELLERAIAITSSLFDKKPVKMIMDAEEGLPDITCDRDRMLQVLINLISNAVKFTDKGSVTLRARKTGAEITLSVMDTGIGIAREDYEKVFEKFKQVGQALTERPKGTGLGLPICKQIVEHHGGRIWVESEEDKGSNFSFALPVSLN